MFRRIPRGTMGPDKITSLIRIRDSLDAISEHLGQNVTEATVVDFHRELDRLSGLSEDVDELRIADHEMEPRIWSYNGRTGEILSQSDERFAPPDRFRMKLTRARRLVNTLVADARAPIAEAPNRSSIREEREALLGTLVEAYRKHPHEFRALRGDDVVTIHHIGLPGGELVPNWTYVEALADVGDLIVAQARTGQWSIRIANKVLDREEDKVSNPPRELDSPPKRSTKVWVIHGRNTQARDLVYALLEAVGLEPIGFEQARRLTGKPSPYIGEILDAAFAEASAIVVLFTDDERVEMRDELKGGRDVAGPEFQPRPNVILEAGMALGKDRKRTVIVEMGPIREISDLSGVPVVKWTDDTPEARSALLGRLEDAGCDVRRTNMRWMSAGKQLS